RRLDARPFGVGLVGGKGEDLGDRHVAVEALTPGIDAEGDEVVELVAATGFEDGRFGHGRIPLATGKRNSMGTRFRRVRRAARRPRLCAMPTALRGHAPNLHARAADQSDDPTHAHAKPWAWHTTQLSPSLTRATLLDGHRPRRAPSEGTPRS